MMILTIKTSEPQAELALYDKTIQIDVCAWEAHRKLADTIHVQIRDLLAKHHYEYQDLDGLVVFQGPGSFTGLRIGITVANTFADGLNIPIVAGSGDDWQATAITRLLASENDNQVLPEYDAQVHITQQKK